MKDYKRMILWVDYFNSSLSRQDGRRVPLSKSVKDPKLDELLEASKRLGFSPEAQEAKHPLRMMVKSGYISVEKKGNLKKVQLIDQVSKTLSVVRGERSAASASSEAVRQKNQPGPSGKRH